MKVSAQGCMITVKSVEQTSPGTMNRIVGWTR